MYIKVLDPYEGMVSSWLEEHPDLLASQIHDWLRERYADLPEVNSKTVFNFVKCIRAKYNIDKPQATSRRQYMKVEETPFGEYAQADFGEMWMKTADKRDLKVYFFVMVLCRSRKKYVYFSRSPFTAEMAVYAHEKAFEYYGGKPRKIIYDQDAVLIHDENLGDCVLTKAFNAFVNQEHFECVFCRKSDPESKGKVENASGSSYSVEKVLLRDLPSLYGISDIQELNKLFLHIAFRSGNEFSYETLSSEAGIKKDTIRKYLEYLEAAFLIKVVNRIDQNAKKMQRVTSMKKYLTNPTLRCALYTPISENVDACGEMVETAIYDQWILGEKTSFYYANWNKGRDKGEVDIVWVDAATQKAFSLAEIKWTDKFFEDPCQLK